MAEISPEHQKRIGEATEALALVQAELEVALREIAAGGKRSDKTMISDVLKIAFEKVTLAREKLESVISDGKR